MKKLILLIISITIFVAFYSAVPTISEAAVNQETEVIIGYENKAGKKEIISNSQTVHHSFANLKAVSVTIKKEKLNKLRHNPNVTYIEENMNVEVSDATGMFTEITEQEIIRERSWNMQVINAPTAWKENFTGKEVKVAVVDSGIADHADLPVAGGTSTVNYTTDWTDDYGHGTHVAGLIGARLNDKGVAGVAPDAALYAVKALDSNGEGTLEDFLEAVDWSIENEMDIINLSLGTKEESAAMKAILQKAYDQGILIVGSSGNNGDGGGVDFPGKFETVIAVSAADISLGISDYSSRGPEVEFSAPGTEVVSTFLNNSYASTSGTSTATPHVTGILAVLKERFPRMSHQELRKELQYHAEDLGETGRDALFGHGLVHYSVFDIFPPAEVSNLTETQVDANSVEISWTPPADEDFNKVNIFFDEEWVGSVPAEKEQKFIITNLPAGSEKKFRMQTEDNIGNGSAGIEFTAASREQQPEAGKTQETNKQPTENEETLAETPTEPSAAEPAQAETEELKAEVPDSNSEEVKNNEAPADVPKENKTPDQTAPNVTKDSQESNPADVAENEESSKTPSKENEAPVEEPIKAESSPAEEKEIKVNTSPIQDTENKAESVSEESKAERGFLLNIIVGIGSFIHSVLSTIGNLFTGVTAVFIK